MVSSIHSLPRPEARPEVEGAAGERVEEGGRADSGESSTAERREGKGGAEGGGDAASEIKFYAVLQGLQFPKIGDWILKLIVWREGVKMAEVEAGLVTVLERGVWEKMPEMAKTLGEYLGIDVRLVLESVEMVKILPLVGWLHSSPVLGSA